MEKCLSVCLKAVCEVWGYPIGSALELLDGALKLRHCTTLFTMRFLPWSLPRVGIGSGKRWDVTPGHHSDPGGNLGKMVRLTKKTRPGDTFHGIPDQGHPTRGDGKDCAALPPKEWGVRWACLAIFFLNLGLGDFALGDAWNLPPEGTGVGFFSGWSVQPKGPVHWHWSALIRRMHARISPETRV